MRHEDDGDTAGLGLRDDPENAGGLLHAQGRGRLIEDQDLRTEVDRAPDGQRLPLAAGQTADQLVTVGDPRNAEGLHLFDGDDPGGLLVKALERSPPNCGQQYGYCHLLVQS